MDAPHPENENLVSRLLEEALRIKSPADREEYLKHASAGDESLLKEVESLLAFAEGLEEFREQPQDLIGQTVGKYKIQDLIGRGGMGTVYRATRTQDYAKTVAIKVINKNMISEEGIRRFGKEMRIMAQLNHANLARLIDGGRIGDDLPYVVMEYIEGQSIDTYCDSNRLGIRERLLLFMKVCAVVSFTHKAEVVHRDIKPGNILVTAEGEPKLIDFGIAKVLNPTYDTQPFALTKLVQAPCSPDYSSPEQIRGDPGIGKATDVYSLGAVLYQILTGHSPHRFRKNTPEEIRSVICEGEILRPSEVIFEVTKSTSAEDSRPGLTPESVSVARACQPQQLRRQLAGSLDSVILKALRKEQRHRYESVEEFAADLENHLNGRSVRAGKKDWWKESRNLIHKLGNNLPPVNVSIKPKLAVYLLLVVALITWRFMPRSNPKTSDQQDTPTTTSSRLLPVKPDSLASTLSASDQEKLQRAINELSDNLGDMLTDERLANDSWELSQMIVSAKDLADFDLGNVHSKLHGQIAPNPYSEWLRRVHLGATDWTMLALLKLGLADPGDLEKRVDFIVTQQRPDGWWPMYPSDPDSAQSPSTYATGYSILALNEYLKSGKVSAGDPRKIREAIHRGQEWLLTTGETSKASWKDAPSNPGGKASDGLSAFVLHVLHRTDADPDELRPIESYWRQNLPTPQSDPTHRYTSQVYANGSRKLIETTNHIVTPWSIIATSDTFAGATNEEKKEAVAWIKTVIDNIDKNRMNPDKTVLKSFPYIKAELLISLRYLLGDEVI